MDKKLQQWREDGKHLPKFLKDFHDQKDFFKFLHESLKIEEHELAKYINWQAGHGYIIDCFLWHCAKFGYTLQKNKSNQEFENIEETISHYNKIRNDNFYKLLKLETEK